MSSFLHLIKLLLNLSFVSQKTDPALALTVWSGLMGLVGGELRLSLRVTSRGGQGKKMTNPKSWSMLCQRNIVKRVLELGGSKWWD